MPDQAADPNAPAWPGADRLAALARYAVLDTPPENGFDDFARLAAQICDAPVGLITFVDDVQQFFKARVGFGGDATAPIEVGFCPLVVRAGEMLLIADTLADPRHAANPAAMDGGVRFYAGVPLVTPDNHVLGTEPRPQGLGERQMEALAALARQVMTLLELKRAVAERDAQAAKLAAVFTQAAVGLSEIAPDGRFLAVNDRLCEMFGRSRDDLLALGVQDVAYPGDLPGDSPLFVSMMGAGEAFSCDKRYVRPNGEIVWANSSITRLLHERGQAGTALAVTVDMTKRRADDVRKEFLLDLSDRLRTLTDPCTIMAETIAALGHHLGADCAGYSEAAAAGECVVVERDWTRPGFPGVVGTHRLDDFSPTMIADLRAGRTVRVDDTARSPQTAGENAAAALARIRTRAFVSVPLVKGGRLVAILFVLSEQPRAWTDGEAGLVEDVMERTRNAVERARAEGAEREHVEALRRSEAQFRTTADALPGMLFVTTADGMNTYVNEGFCDYAGRRHDELLGDRWAEILHLDDAARALATWSEAVRTGLPYFAEYRFRRHDGAWRWHMVRGLPVPDGKGGIDRWVGTCTDIHDRRVLEAELRLLNAELADRVARATFEREAALAQLHEAQKLESIGQLTGGIAHDFNNMLQGVSGSLELMQRRIAQGRAEEAGRFVDAARKTVERAAALTHRLLAFARRQTLQPRPVEPDELVEGMAELIRRTVGPEVEVELRMGEGIWTVLCDPNQLESALLNLAINARDAMPGGGRLTVGTEDVRLSAADIAGQDGARAGDYVEITVADTGTGMDEATRARAFEPFFTTKPLGQGTGLGLSQLYGFVRQSGGFVRLDSAPGRGTAVRLSLPRNAGASGAHEAAAATDLQAGPAVSGGTVLLVDDEAGVRTVLAEALRELGYRVLEAGDGPGGLDALLQARERVDVLVTDVGLPGLNGRQLADAARERDPGLPVLLITGYAGPALDGWQLAPGMEVIAKPFTLQALATRVADVLRERSSAAP